MMGAERYHQGRDEVTGAVVRHRGLHSQEPGVRTPARVTDARSIIAAAVGGLFPRRMGAHGDLNTAPVNIITPDDIAQLHRA